MTGPLRTSDGRERADVLVIGDGVIGLSIALAVARAGGSCHVIGKTVDGQASSASAGLLAPSLGLSSPAFRAFMRASRDRYPDWLRWLAERTGVEVTLNRMGILEIGGGEIDAGQSESHDTRALGASELRSLEPALAAADGAVLHVDDGYVDNVGLLRALREALRCEWSIDFIDGRGASIEPSRGECRVNTEDGRTLRGGTAVLAAGAWSALVAGVPRPVYVEPVRGQMLLLDGAPLSHAVSTSDAYLVPREGGTLVGSTLERMGFDNRTTAAARAHLRSAAAAAVPELHQATVQAQWAGLRPMTPDGLPVLGRDPEVSSLVYACGHGKNGILLAPLTAECIAAEVASSRAPYDLALFSIERFEQRDSQ
jgi:glycine oxidase